jgi:hypothetical protein
MIEEGGKPLSHVSRIGLSEDGVTVSGDNTTTLQSRPNILFDGIIGDIHSDSILHLHNPSQDFLIGKTVKRASKTIQPSRQRQHGTRQRRSNEMSRMSRDIPTLVIRVDGQVQSHQLDEIGVFAESHEVGEIVAIVLILFDDGELSVFVDIAVDSGCDGGEFGDKGH